MAKLNMQSRYFFFEMKDLFSTKGLERLDGLVNRATPPATDSLHHFENALTEIQRKYPKDYLSPNLINVAKKRAEGSLLARAKRLQTARYGFEAVEVVENYLLRPRTDGEIPQNIIVHARWQAQPKPKVKGPPLRGPPRPTARAPLTGSLSANSASSPPRSALDERKHLRGVLLDVVINDSDFRKELSVLAREVVEEEREKLANEINRLLLTGAMPNHHHEHPPVKEGESRFSFIKDDAARVILQKTFPEGRLSTWHHHDVNGEVSNDREHVNIDVLFTNDTYHLISMKQEVGVDTIAKLVKIGNLYHSQNPDHTLACVVVSPVVTDNAKILAQRCSVRLLFTL
eukprot:TRINITY_DN8755_c0_g1_i1.p1 TRINITY_DN8755_c0_g1~~TRINITY_DN8755_c0_g1_i1.p1  ORF type:complete len:398 (-),score=78.47 TRINITY_DN8755_c0_g1_i1:24-1055(-)